jgi:plasmid stabilization system protein ParE
VSHSVRYTRAASAEVEAAISWYARPEIDQATSFIKDLERTEARLRSQPALYQQVEGEIRRAVLRRFPYSLFYVIERDEVLVLACMHQHRKLRTWEEWMKR